MTTNQQYQLSNILSGTLIDKRFVNWLWLYFKNRHPQLDPGEFQSHGMNSRMADFISNNLQIKREIEQWKNSLFLPDGNLQWITNDKRQQQWIAQRIVEKIGFNHIIPPHNLTDRDLVIAMIDTWSIDPNQKSNEVRSIEMLWNQYKQDDHIFQWFNGPDESQKITLALELIGKKYPLATVYKELFKTHQELLIFFDQTNWHVAEKTLLIDAIKKRWSQNKYREKMIEKKQYNFILSNKSIARLDNLADKYDLKRVEILEILLEMEDKKGVYIQAKLNPLAES